MCSKLQHLRRNDRILATLHIFNNYISNIYEDTAEQGEIKRGIALQKYR